MSAPAFQIDNAAKLQVAQLANQEKRALRAFFRSPAANSTSKMTADGMRVARVGARRVLWKLGPKGTPVVLSIVDSSYAPKT